MILLLGFSFLAGIVTILSPCILPILPIVLSSSVSKGKKRPLGIVTGFILSFTFFTLFLTSIVRLFSIPADTLRIFSVFVILLFGLSLFSSRFQKLLEQLFSKLSKYVPKNQNREGFGGGIIVGISIGLLWTPCVGPILASVISLALTGTVTFQAFLITLAYSLGTAIPMLIIIYSGQKVLTKVPWLLKNTENIQKIFGFIMILTSIAIYFNFDRKFQTYILQKFPNYGVGLTQFEENDSVSQQLQNLGKEPTRVSIGKPASNLFNQNYSAPELILGGEWFNLPEGKESITLEEFRGKVVLVDFWTYTCINCIRTLPYLKDWHQKYADDGLVIIGVHTPEFEFEKDADNVAKAIEDFGIKYIVMQDNNYSTWKNYNNHYWPAEYLIDKNGNVRRTHFGEGKYDETEEAIQTLLSETGADVSNTQINDSTYQIESGTPETYLGYGRIQYLASPEKIVKDSLSDYTRPANLRLNTFAYEGLFNLGEERAMATKGAKLYFNFKAKDVYLVMRPKEEGLTGRVKVSLDDGKVVDQFAGEDVVDGVVMVDSDRLYKLIHFNNAQQGELILEFLDNNTELYAFTFG
jgi:cytochrome c biogenesis protein CcdA/thiol-disulfide isomerase/thioredoxin